MRNGTMEIKYSPLQSLSHKVIGKYVKKHNDCLERIEIPAGINALAAYE